MEPKGAYLSPEGANGVGPVWVKIFELGFNGVEWATDKLRANEGKVNFLVVSDSWPCGLNGFL